MNLFKYIICKIFRKASDKELLRLGENKDGESNGSSNDERNKFISKLREQTIKNKKEVEIRECVGSGAGFKKSISC